jgi:hypothetical protein
VPGLDLLEEQFLTSMNALAAAEDTPEITTCQVEIQIWRDGYDQPAFSSQARYAGWTVLAASPAPSTSNQAAWPSPTPSNTASTSPSPSLSQPASPRRRTPSIPSSPPPGKEPTMAQQPNERTATSLRLEAPGLGLGLGLDPDEIDTYLDAVNAGLIIAETRCDKGMQDNFALRAETTIELATS